MLWCFCYSALAAELLSKCGVKENKIILNELETWNVDYDDDNRASQLRACGADFLEQYVTNLAGIIVLFLKMAWKGRKKSCWKNSILFIIIIIIIL